MLHNKLSISCTDFSKVWQKVKSAFEQLQINFTTQLVENMLINFVRKVINSEEVLSDNKLI